MNAHRNTLAEEIAAIRNTPSRPTVKVGKAANSENLTGIPAFFEGLAAHLIDQVNPKAIVQPFAVGEGVYYQGSKVADHGAWKVTDTDPRNERVTLGRPGSPRTLVVNTKSVRALTDSEVTAGIAAALAAPAVAVLTPAQRRAELIRRNGALYTQEVNGALAALKDSYDLAPTHSGLTPTLAAAAVHAALAQAAATRLVALAGK